MRKRNIISSIIIVLLLGTNIVSLFIYNEKMVDKNEELKEAYELILEQEDQIDELKITENKYNELLKEHSVLAESEKELEKKNQTLFFTYQSLTAKFEMLKRDREELEERITQMDEQMKDYDYVFNYDPVTLEEYQTYIKELEDRILAKGGFDKYEQPKRWKEYEDIVIWLEDGSNIKWADQLHEYILKLPPKMIEELNDKGWMIILTPRNLEKVYESGIDNTVGLTLYYQSRIYIQNNEFSIAYCTIHEIGHALDFIHNFISFSSEWELIYETEAKSSGLGTYFAGSSSEYFAETFQTYFTDPESLQDKAPLSYEYMNNFVAEFR